MAITRLAATLEIDSQPPQATTDGSDVTKHFVKIVMLSGNELNRWEFGGDFVIDLASAIVPSTIVVDYNHDANLILGLADGIRVEGQSLVGRGVLLSRNDPAKRDECDQRVDKIISDLQEHVPYNASITFTHEHLEMVNIPKGESVIVDGVTYQGEINILKKINLRGVSICPFGEDDGTEISLLALKALKQKATEMAKQPHENRELTTIITPGITKLEVDNKPPLTEDKKPAPDASREDAQKYIDEFGLEAGYRLWYEQVPYEDAKEQRYQEMKAKLSTEADKTEPDSEKTDESKPETPPKKEETNMGAVVTKLTALVEKQSNQITELTTKLTTMLSADPVSTGGKNQQPTNARQAYIDELNATLPRG